MKIIEKPICDKCGGTEFSIECIDKVKYISAKEYYAQIQSQYAQPITTPRSLSTYQAICKKCGKVYEYERL